MRLWMLRAHTHSTRSRSRTHARTMTLGWKMCAWMKSDKKTDDLNGKMENACFVHVNGTNVICTCTWYVRMLATTMHTLFLCIYTVYIYIRICTKTSFILQRQSQIEKEINATRKTTKTICVHSVQCKGKRETLSPSPSTSTRVLIVYVHEVLLRAYHSPCTCTSMYIQMYERKGKHWTWQCCLPACDSIVDWDWAAFFPLVNVVFQCFVASFAILCLVLALKSREIPYPSCTQAFHKCVVYVRGSSIYGIATLTFTTHSRY